MNTDVPEEKQEETTGKNSDWDNRILCNDGNCIGVIGPDGLCKECGQKYEGELELPEMNPSEEEEDTPADEAASSSAATEIPDDADALVDDDWGNRALCSDGNCIGVIGSDGKCKECGKSLE